MLAKIVSFLHRYRSGVFIVSAFAVWKMQLAVIARLAQIYVPARTGFLGPTPWSNFDGVHYLSIAERGYVQFEQAFFPLYPLLIGYLARTLNIAYVTAGEFISNICFLLVLGIFWKILMTLFNKRKDRFTLAAWSLMFMLFFPTSFYFAGVYTESIFMAFVLVAIYSLLKKRFVLYGISAALASGTRLIGAFFLVPIGLFAYMGYLYKSNGDPLLFIHAQPAFGANRTGGDIVILPQVFWRYAKIFYTVPPNHYDYWIALLEVVMLFYAFGMLWYAWKKDLPRRWIYFSLAAVIVPTLTGTLSSVPRYILVAIPMYIAFALLPKRLRVVLFIVNYALFILLTVLFTRGYWVA